VCVPNLLSFFGAEVGFRSGFDSLISFLVNEFENMLVPEDSVFNEASVAKGADNSAVLINIEIENRSLDL
jgi:hypothetical protein